VRYTVHQSLTSHIALFSSSAWSWEWLLLAHGVFSLFSAGCTWECTQSW